MDRADEGLRLENHGRLNERFYEGKPWVYFERRLMHLSLMAADSDRLHAALVEPIQLGPLAIQEHQRELADDEPSGLDDQSFAAAEAQVILHHVSETLLRLCDAHAPRADGSSPPCPWLEMSRRQGPGQFKRWVTARISDAPRESVEKLAAFLFADAVGGEEATRRLTGYVRLFAEHFLDAPSYNAAKHGFALQGARSRLTARVADIDVIDDEGLTIEWLGVQGNPPRWARTTRWFSVEATIALSFMGSWMIRALWLAARARYLDDPVEEAFSATAPDEMLAAFGVVHPVLLEVDDELRYEGCERTLRIRKRVRRGEQT